MKACRIFLACVPLVARPAAARDRFSPGPTLSEADVAAFAGKSYAVVKTDPPFPRINVLVNKFSAGNFGSVPTTVGSDRTVRFDPADLVIHHLAREFERQFGLVPAARPGPYAAKAHWKDIAGAPTDADYLLYARTTALIVDDRGHFFTGRVWSALALRVAVVERATARPMFLADCYRDTYDSDKLTTVGDLSANQGRLYGDLTSGMAWRCMQLVAGAMLPKPALLPDMPAEFVDPLGDFARMHPKLEKQR